MKRALLFVIAGLITAASGFAEGGKAEVSALMGSWSFSLDDATAQLTVKGEGIINETDRDTGRLKYAVIASEAPYDGSSLEGWTFCEAELDPLKHGFHYNPIEKVLPLMDKPPTGDYSFALVLFEEKYGQFGIISWINYSGKIHFENQTGKKVKALLDQIESDQKSFAFYQSMMSSSTDVNMIGQYGTTLLQLNQKIYQSKMELIGLGYIVDSPNPKYSTSYKNSYSGFFQLKPQAAPVATSPAPAAPAYVPAPAPVYSPAPAKPPRNEAYIQHCRDELADAREKYRQDKLQEDLDAINGNTSIAHSLTIQSDIRMVSHWEQELQNALGN